MDLLVDTNRVHSAVLAEHDDDGALLGSYTHGAGPIAQQRDGTTSYYHADRLGSTRLLTDAAGAVTDAYRYEAFGALAERTGGTDNPYLFTGERFEEQVGLYHLRARDYDPATGRFRTVDPFLGVERDPVTLHRYLYAYNNPVTNIDPGGEFAYALPMPVPIWGQLAAALTAALPMLKMAVFLATVAAGMVCAAGAATSLVVATSRNTPCRTKGINIFYTGDENRETTKHIAGAIARRPIWSVLTYASKGDSGGWYNSRPECDRKLVDRTGKVCDEYPFFSTVQGGPTAQPPPSLKLVPAVEGPVQGGRLGSFYRTCRLQSRDPVDGRFLVVPIKGTLPPKCKNR